jgi:uncharacterized protein (DUF1015 family)
VSTVDSGARGHEMWSLGKGDRQDQLLDLLREQSLLVADGNHRVTAAAATGSLLALVTAGPALRALPEGQRPVDGADAVLLLAPVPYQDVLAVHAEGRLMPRKATYFTPKPRSGLLLADVYDRTGAERRPGDRLA